MSLEEVPPLAALVGEGVAEEVLAALADGEAAFVGETLTEEDAALNLTDDGTALLETMIDDEAIEAEVTTETEALVEWVASTEV